MHPDPAEAMLRVAGARPGGDRVGSDWHGRPFDAAEHPLVIIEACPQGA